MTAFRSPCYFQCLPVKVHHSYLVKCRCPRFSNYLSSPWLSTLRWHFGWLREGLYFRQYVTYIVKYWINIKEIQLCYFCWRSPSISQLEYWPLFSLLVCCLWNEQYICFNARGEMWRKHNCIIRHDMHCWHRCKCIPWLSSSFVVTRATIIKLGGFRVVLGF